MTPEQCTKALEIIRAGNYECVAAKAVGIGKQGFSDYKRRHPDFKAQVNEAVAEAEQAMVNTIVVGAMTGDWKAASFYLERKHPDRWSKQDRQTLPLVDFDNLSREQLLRIKAGENVNSVLANPEAEKVVQ